MSNLSVACRLRRVNGRIVELIRDSSNSVPRSMAALGLSSTGFILRGLLSAKKTGRLHGMELALMHIRNSILQTGASIRELLIIQAFRNRKDTQFKEDMPVLKIGETLVWIVVPAFYEPWTSLLTILQNL